MTSAAKNSDKAAAPRGRPFAKGTSGNPRGKRKGVQNKVTREVQVLARGIVEDPAVQAKLLSQARRGRLAPPVMAMLFHYAYGKPKDTVALEGGPESKPKKLVILIQREPPEHLRGPSFGGALPALPPGGAGIAGAQGSQPRLLPAASDLSDTPKFRLPLNVPIPKIPVR
jgi:Family of unknown function (DUF5681)